MRALLAVAGLVVLAAVLLGAGIVWWSGATLATDASALARVQLQPLAGSLVSTRVTGPAGRAVPATIAHGRIVPRVRVEPGASLTVVVVVRRPSWLRWLVGRQRTERLRVEAPVARLTTRWVTLAPGSPLRLRFAGRVARVAVGPARPTHTLTASGRSVSVGRQAASGSLAVAAAARTWELLGQPTLVSWFPSASKPTVLADPEARTVVSPLGTIRLTFAQSVADVLGSARPRFSPSVAGSWELIDSHTLLFTPGRLGFPLAGTLHLVLPRRVAVIRNGTAVTTQTAALEWTVAAGSLLRLDQLLAQQGYLPVSWQPTGDPVAATAAAQVDAAVDPPAGTFAWRYSNTPSLLKLQWNPDRITEITRGAIMTFEDEHALPVDGLAGPRVWQAMLADALSGKSHTGGYSYVYVHTKLPQLLTLWHDGKTVLTSPGNTGIPAAPTQPGTYPVFEHIPVGTMQGTNPDGTHYDDPGIRWISYFHGGDALHSFPRASYGTPQSLGCVELPLSAAAAVWPYTPVGTLVTIEPQT